MLGMSLLPCCRYHPAGIGQTLTSLVCLCCLRPQIAGSASRVFRLRGHLCVYLRYGLVTCSSPFTVTLSIGFRDLVTLLSAILATGLLAITLTGLPPAEHTSLSWTHNPVRNFNTWGYHKRLEFSMFLITTKCQLLILGTEPPLNANFFIYNTIHQGYFQYFGGISCYSITLDNWPKFKDIPFVNCLNYIM